MTLPYFALWATHDLSFKDSKKNHEIGHSIQSCLIELCQVLSTEVEILERGLRKKTFLIPHRQTGQSIHWTGRATDLVELLYALDTCDCINDGEIGVEELADALSEIFGVEIKNCYNVYMNMKRRKDDSRTYFLDGPERNWINVWWRATWKAENSRNGKCNKGRYSIFGESPFIYFLQLSVAEVFLISQNIGYNFSNPQLEKLPPPIEKPW